MDAIPTSFSQLLRQTRLKCGWSQKQLARKIKTTRVTIYRWEQGFSVPSPMYWQGLSTFLNLQVEAFFVPDNISSKIITDFKITPEEETSNIHTSSPLQITTTDQINIPKQNSPIYPPSVLSSSHIAKEEWQNVLEQQQLAQVEQHLMLHCSYLQYVCKLIEIVLTLLDPNATQDLRLRMLELLFLQLEKDQNEKNREFVLISFTQVKHAFILAKQEEAHANCLKRSNHEYE